MSRSVHIFAGGGTGGHLYPGLAVAQELRQQDEHSQIVFACSYRPIDRPRISRMISSVPPPIGPRRASRAARSIPYSAM